LVENVITPFVGILMMGANFAGLSFGIAEAQIKYGMFVQAILDFAIVTAVLFLVVKGIKKAQSSTKKEKTVEEKVVASLTKDQSLLEEIRDLLKKTK
jgi:large conductance mechanosensitive channel